MRNLLLLFAIIFISLINFRKIHTQKSTRNFNFTVCSVTTSSFLVELVDHWVGSGAQT